MVGDIEHLDYLYLLTVADIRGTNPELWNSWKDALLIELYHSARRTLMRGLGTPLDLEAHIADIQAQALALLREQSVDEAPHCGASGRAWTAITSCSIPPRRSAGTPGSSSPRPRRALPLISIREQTQRGATEMFIYAADRENLFAITARALDTLGLDIVDARIMTTTGGYTLDTYIVLDEDGQVIKNDYRLQEITATLKSALAKPYDPSGGVTRRPSRQVRHFHIETEVIFSADERNQRTVMEVIATDRPGLLSQVGQAMVECGVRVKNAKIATFGARVEDIFFITDDDNRPLTSQARRSRLSEAIKKRLDEQAQAQETAYSL